MPKVSDAHREAQRARIKEATLQVLSEHGLAGASMGEVIRASGLSAGAIYGYFKNKDQLVADVAADMVSGRVEIIEEMAARRPVPHPFEMIARLVTGLPDQVLHSGLLLELWGNAERDQLIGDLMRAQFARITASIGAYVSAWLADSEGSAPSDPAVATLGTEMGPVFVAIAQGYLVRRAVEGEVGATAYLASLDAFRPMVAARTDA